MFGLICPFEYQGCEAKDEMGRGFEDVSKKVVEMICHGVQGKKGKGGDVELRLKQTIGPGEEREVKLREQTCNSEEVERVETEEDVLRVGGMSPWSRPRAHNREHSYTSPCCTGRQVWCFSMFSKFFKLAL